MAHQFLGGTWTTGSGGTADVVNPFDASVVARLDQGGPADVDAAVAAARTAFDAGPWPRTPAAERAALLRRVADLLQRDRAEIARTETLDTGKTLVESGIDVDDVTAVFRYYADLVATDSGRLVDTGLPHVVSRVVHEPVGVCALVTPWNYPLLQLSWKVAPALAAGNAVVIKPSEVTPLTSLTLVELLTIRTELTDRLLIFGEQHLRTVLTRYSAHYNRRRPHRALQLVPPRPDQPTPDLDQQRIRRRPVLGGLINEHERAA